MTMTIYRIVAKDVDDNDLLDAMMAFSLHPFLLRVFLPTKYEWDPQRKEDLQL